MPYKGPQGLPASCDDSAVTIQGAKKWGQLGSDAAGKVLTGAISGSELPPRSAVVCQELFSSACV